LGLRIGQAGKRVDEDLDDLLGRAVGDLLDVHAAFARRDHGHLLGATVGHDGQVVFLLDVGAIFNIETADLLSFGAGLVRLELHAQDLASQAPDVFQALGNLHTATLAAATGVDLGLDHPDRAAEFLGGSDSFVNGERRDTSWDRHTESAQDLFALVFVNLHGVKTRSWSCVLMDAPRRSDGGRQDRGQAFGLAAVRREHSTGAAGWIWTSLPSRQDWAADGRGAVQSSASGASPRITRRMTSDEKPRPARKRI